MLLEQRERPRRRGSSSDAGQMVVELCAVAPVIVMVAVLVLDSLVYAASCSGFDHLAAQGALSVAGAPAGTEFSPQQAAQDLQARLQEGRGERERVEVEVDQFQCENVPEGKTAQVVTNQMTVKIFGTEADVAAVTAEDITLVADLSDFSAASGSYTVPVTVKINTSGDVGASRQL